MKGSRTVLLLMLVWGGLAFGQESTTQVISYSEKLPKTKLGHFEKTLELSNSQKDSLKQKHQERLAQLYQMIDTLDISEKRRRRLFKLLKTNPFSEHLSKIVATLDD